MKTPTNNLMNEYIAKWDHFDSNSKYIRYFLEEPAIQGLFDRFDNSSYNNLLIKSICLNQTFSTGILDKDISDKFVLQFSKIKNIDSRIKSGDLNIIEEIAHCKNSKNKRYYSFATKFCCLQNPNKYPIYDSVVVKTIWKCRKLPNGFVPKYTLDQIYKHYNLYKETIDSFIKFYSLKPKNYRELDKFLWLWGKEIEDSKNKVS